jgi:hypothetical protein
MPFKNSLQLYTEVVIPKLVDGPKTLAQLGVPEQAMRRLAQHGIVRQRMFNIAPAVTVAVWFLTEDLALLDEVNSEHSSPTTMHCWELTDEDFGPPGLTPR